MDNQLKDYESVMDINDSKQVKFLKDRKAMLAEMRSNVKAGKASLEEMNKFILEKGLIQGISEQVKTMSKLRVDWFALTGATEIIDSNNEATGGLNEIINPKIKATRDRVIKSLENASSEAVEERQSEQQEARSLSQLGTAPEAKKTTNSITELSIVKMKESFTS